MISEADRLRFSNIICKRAANGGDDCGIGTLTEKSLHLTLKRYFAEEGACVEAPYMGYIADIMCGDDITEVQTATLSGMRDKLSAFLQDKHVRIIWPVAVRRRIVWVDPESGMIMPSNRAAPRQTLMSLLPQLIYILDYLCSPSLLLTAVSIAVDEYRVRGGRMSRGRAADLKLDRVPTELIDVTDMRFPKSAEMFIPDGLEPEFTRVEFSAASHLRGRNLWAALKVLEHLGSIRRVQSSGNRITYRISDRNHA